MKRVLIVVGLLALNSPAGAAPSVILTLVHNTSYVFHGGGYYNDLQGWTDCPPGYAVTGARVTNYATLNKNINHIRCTQVSGLTGFIQTRELNHDAYRDFKSGSGYNECPAGWVIVGVFLRDYGTTDHNVTIVKCQRIQNLAADGFPTMVHLDDGCEVGHSGCTSTITRSDPAWGYCPGGQAAIGIGTIDYAQDGGSSITDDVLKKLTARKYAVRFKCQFTDESLCVFDDSELGNGAVNFLTKVFGQTVVEYLAYAWPILKEAIDIARFIFGIIQNGFDTDQFNRTERGLTCVPLPGGCS